MSQARRVQSPRPPRLRMRQQSSALLRAAYFADTGYRIAAPYRCVA
jgi:hypothetical protein